VRRRWWLLLGSVLLAAGAAGLAGARWSAARASDVQADLVAARGLLGRAASLGATPAPARLALIGEAGAHARAARARLDQWPLHQLAAVPLLGRDVRLARTLSRCTVDIVGATGGVAAALAPLQRGTGPSQAGITRAANALLALSGTLDQSIARVRAARPLLLGQGPRSRFLDEAGRASQTAATAGRGLRLAATLYGPPGAARYFLAFQNPAELRGTGGLIGQYGVLESSRGGPRLTEVASYTALDARTRGRVRLPAEVARRYRRFAVDRTWSAVNIPPDLPTVGRIVVDLYQRATGSRLDGMIAVDPLAVAEILRVSGPITVEGLRLTAGNVAPVTLVGAYVRYAADNRARRAFLEKTARATFTAFRGALAARPDALVRALALAARGRHLQVYSRDAAVERAIEDLGIGGGTAAPATGDYLMPVAINTGGNKLDAFLRRTLRYRVTLEPDGGARANASITLRNGAPARGLPRYIAGPYDKRFRAGDNSQFQMLYVAGGYGFSRATRDGRRVGAEPQAELGGLAISQQVVVPPGRSVTLAYDLERRDAVRVSGGRASYQLLVRPQPTVHADRLELSLRFPRGWRPLALPSGFRQRGDVVSWSGVLDRSWTFRFVFDPTA
jgi:hypothetical protein